MIRARASVKECRTPKVVTVLVPTGFTAKDVNWASRYI